jgi:hypothetical protein
VAGEGTRGLGDLSVFVRVDPWLTSYSRRLSLSSETITAKRFDNTAQGRPSSSAPWARRRYERQLPREGFTRQRVTGVPCKTPSGYDDLRWMRFPGCARRRATLGCTVRPLRGETVSTVGRILFLLVLLTSLLSPTVTRAVVVSDDPDLHQVAPGESRYGVNLDGVNAETLPLAPP